MSSLPERPDLRFEKKQAKALLKAFNEKDSAAVARMHAHLPRLKDAGAFDATLADAQFVLARERGFESWPKLKAHIEGLQPLEEQVMPFLRAACMGKPATAQRLLKQHPQLPKHSFQAAAAAADPGALTQWVERNPKVAVKKGSSLVDPPPDMKPLTLPLLAACASHLHKLSPKIAAASVQCVRLLLDHGADPNSRDTSEARLPVLYHACVSNNVAVVRLLLERGAEVNDGESVHHSAELNHRDCLELLLAHGADLSTRHPHWKKTILYFLAEIDARPEGVQWLLEHGADPSVPSGDLRETPLARAAANGNLALVNLLIRFGADPNVVRADGRSSYALAVRGGNTAVCERLRAAGARAGGLTDSDEFLGACLRADEVTARAALAKSPELLKRLSDGDRRLLFRAVPGNQLNVLKLMTSLGFDAGMLSEEGATLLHHAAWFGRLEIVKWLLGLRVPVNVRDGQYGSSALAWAVHGSRHSPRDDKTDAEYCSIVDALIDAGSTPEQVINKWDEPPHGTRIVVAHLAKRGFLPKQK